ncbi:MAG: hypothetical protein JXB49_24190 [Bacteroidales bacterium]|nr:hypothetical protein [Bacteroidales bacterium]
MKKRITILVILTVILTGSMLVCCKIKTIKNNNRKMETFSKGTYGFDKQFLENHLNVIELKSGNASIAIIPALQGRVITSTCEGDKGFSFGWINYDLIESGEKLEHFNPYGGEERFWIGPEGGQFSIYFKKGEEFIFDNWFVPSQIDTEPFDLIRKDSTSTQFYKEIALQNYSGTKFTMEVNRNIILLSNKQIGELLNLPENNLSMVAYESSNTIKNKGKHSWTKETGLPSVWMLSMLIPSPEVTVVIPIKPGDVKEMGVKFNDDYFGKIKDDRLKVVNNIVFFKADGKSRGKIGIPPLRAAQFMGSYDSQNKALTILECILPENNTDYVNSAWEIQDNPYGGDAFNSYNDGPLEDGSQMGPFFELESSSPALELKPEQSYTHLQRIYHFKGDKEELNRITEKVLHVSIEQIETIF